MARSGNMGGGAKGPGDHNLGVLCNPHVAGVAGVDGGGGGRSVQGKLRKREGFPQGSLGRELARSLGSLLLAPQQGSLGRVLDPPPHASFFCSHSLPHPLFAGLNLQERKF